ncbi:MAG: cytochrome c maturation protein CcmE [Ilumatobacteraceae bacterium]
MDLSPRETNVAPAPRVRKRQWRYVALLSIVVVAGVVVVSQFLNSAIDYYCNVDEIGVKEGCDPDRRIRVQGTVEEGSVKQVLGATTFTLEFNGETLAVAYEGDPGGIFQECIPVVAHGRMNGDTFEANRIEVRHSNEYVAENSERVDEAKKAGCSMITG